MAQDFTIEQAKGIAEIIIDLDDGFANMALKSLKVEIQQVKSCLVNASFVYFIAYQLIAFLIESRGCQVDGCDANLFALSMFCRLKNSKN